MTKLIHIGLGKCGSTFLQESIFPKIAREKNIEYIDLNKFIFKKKIKFHLLENEYNLEKKLPNKFIISNEKLFSLGWEFSRISKSFHYIKKNFSNQTTILIIIRNPYELLNSIYCQSIINNSKIIKPESFFYIKNSTKIRVSNKYNLYNFDYFKLISLYKSYFKKVVVVKYENLNNLDFIKDIFELNHEFIKELKLDKKKYNRSLSKFSYNIYLFMDKFINLKKFQSAITSQIKPSDNVFFKIKNKILYFILLRQLSQLVFDKIVPYRKFYINRDKIPIDINKAIKSYNKLNL